MTDFLDQVFEAADRNEPAKVVASRLVLAAAFGGAVALTRTLTLLPEAKPSPGFRTTLVLLTVLTALVFEVIGSSLARAFGLAGALAVVRFRTVVDDTRDSAFVIFAMATGMAVGAGYLKTASVGLPVVLAVGLLARLAARKGPLAEPPADAVLDIRLKTGHGVELELPQTLAKFGTGVRLVESGTTKEGDGLDLRYHIRPRQGADPTTLVLDLKARPGVEKVNISLK